MVCYKYISHLPLKWILQYIQQATHTPHPCQMYQTLPPDSAQILIMAALHTSHVALVLFGRRSCHTHASRWAASQDAKVQPADGIAVANIEVKPPRYVGRMYENARWINMLLDRCYQRLGFAVMASASSIPPGAVGSADQRQHDRNGTRCVAHQDVGRIQKIKACSWVSLTNGWRGCFGSGGSLDGYWYNTFGLQGWNIDVGGDGNCYICVVEKTIASLRRANEVWQWNLQR